MATPLTNYMYMNMFFVPGEAIALHRESMSFIPALTTLVVIHGKQYEVQNIKHDLTKTVKGPFTTTYWVEIDLMPLK